MAAILWPVIAGLLGLVWIGVHLAQRCRHQWQTIDSGPLVNRDGLRVGSVYEQQCERCGFVEMRELRH